MSRLFSALAVSPFVLASACGLGVVGTGPSDEDAGAIVPSEAGGVPDASSPGDLPDAAVAVDGGCSTGSTCTAALAPGWKPIAFANDRTAACPAGYTTTDLVTSPVTAAGACACACAIAGGDPPTCAKGSFSASIGTTNTCSSAGQTFTVNGTGCTAAMAAGSLSTYAKYSPLPLTPGTCTSTVQKDATKLTSTSVRACEPPAACAEDTCLGTGLASFASCIAHDGDVACPAGPFSNKKLAGLGATLTCSGCTACTNTATCGPATLRFYNDAACATELASRLVNGNCNTVSGTAGASVSHFKYEAATNNPTCTPAANPITTPALDTPRTLCCR